MYPIVPPPANDTGAQTFPRTLQRWLDVNPLSKLTRTSGYITLPVFSQAVTWNGYSDIVATFNYEGPNNFSLQSISAALPLNPNYVLCIMWKTTSGTVYRYALWLGVGEVFYFPVNLYTGQKIAKNFRFEIWSTNSTPAVQTTALTFYTSVLGGQDYRWAGDFVLVTTDGQNNSFNNINTVPGLPTPPQTGINLWLTQANIVAPGGLVTTWTDTGGQVFTPDVSNTIVAASFVGRTYLIPTTSHYMKNTSLTNTTIFGHVFISLLIGSSAAGNNSVFQYSGTTGNYFIAYSQPTNTLTVCGQAFVLAQGSYIVDINNIANTITIVNPANGSYVVNKQSYTHSALGTPSSLVFGYYGTVGWAEMMFYTNALSATNENAVINYLIQEYNNNVSIMSLPLTFPSTSQPTGN